MPIKTEKSTNQKTKKSRSPYGETFSTNAAENYEQFFVPAIGKPLAKELVDMADLRRGEHVLDVVCGTGIITRLASQKVESEGAVTGLDINPGMLTVAQSVAKPTSSIKWHQASAEDMPLNDEVFDVLFCQLGLQFMEDKPAALQEMYRVLKNNGRLLFNLPGPTGPLFKIFASALEKHINKETAGFVNHVFSLHDTTEIRQLLSAAGFHEIEIEAEEKLLRLPAPKDFLWQYIHSTPMIEIVSKVKKQTMDLLEKDIVEDWQQSEQIMVCSTGNVLYQQRHGNNRCSRAKA